MQKEEQLLQKRFSELSKLAYTRDIVTYSDFLNLNELNILHSLPKDFLYTGYQTFGGYDSAERQMAVFLPDALCYEPEYPFSVLKLAPLHKKYAEPLTHRDYLGAILNLGIERCKLGDIVVTETDTFIFLQTALVPYVKVELARVRHTAVLVTEERLENFGFVPSYEEIKGTVATVRLDSLLALVCQASRSKLTGLIEGAKVFVNGKLITTNSYQVKDNDIISVRGIGKFQYMGVLSYTKKNRIYVSVHKYI